MGYVPCVVPNCEDKTSTRHRFPNPKIDKVRFNQWISLINNPKLFEMDPERTYRSYRVCHQHFNIEDRSTNMFLVKTALPSQKLPHRKTEPASSTSTSEIPSYVGDKDINVSSVVEVEDISSGISPLNISQTYEEICQTPTTSRHCTIKQGSSKPLLEPINVFRSVQLTPKARFLYKTARRLKNVVSVYKQRSLSFKRRLESARRYFFSCKSSLRSEAVDFCLQQLTRKITKKRGIRYSFEEKLMSLALYKTSGAGYRFLSKLFNLPSRRTLSRLLKRIPIQEGINEFLMANLAKSITHFKSHEKICMLMFDEISLMPHVSYDKHSEKIIGVECQNISDHALVFMVRGVTRKWKQTVCYTFCKGSTKALQIKKLLISLIRSLKNAGLRVIATICDQGATNKSAIENMVNEARATYIKNELTPRRRIIVEDQEIIPLYDVPHLIKGIRNNLLTKNLIWKTSEGILEAKWKDIMYAYHIDANCGDIRCLPKISERHVVPGKIRKMKVSSATQIFSHSMAAVIAIMARNSETDASGVYTMDKRAQETSKLLKFFDTVFDSLNGGSLKAPPGKPLKGAVTSRSSHISFWKQSVGDMRRMYFRSEGSEEKFIPPSLKNFIFTIEGFIELAELISSNNIRFWLPRSFNQDPLENYFAQVRQHGGRNINPTCAQFKYYYKALLIRNITSPHSVSANCEETFEVSLLQLEDLLKTNKNIITNVDSIALEDFRIDNNLSKLSNNYFQRPISKIAVGYISGFIAKKVLDKYTCEFCKIHILKNDYTDEIFSELAVEKEFSNNRKLTYCNDVFIKCIYKVYNISKFILSNYFKTDIKKTIFFYSKKYVNFSFVCDHKTALIDFILNYVIDLCIFIFCKTINDLLSGKATELSDNSCSLFKAALQINLNRKKYSK